MRQELNESENHERVISCRLIHFQVIIQCLFSDILVHSCKVISEQRLGKYCFSTSFQAFIAYDISKFDSNHLYI